MQTAINNRISSAKNWYANTQTAITPTTMVSTSWPMLPTAIATIPTTRRLGDKKKTLPPYSPSLFGVKTAHVSPQNTDSTANHNFIGSIDFNSRFHFTASINQLISIISSTTPKTLASSFFGLLAMMLRNPLRLLLSASFA